MARKPSSQPTEVELNILTVLWDQGSATVRQVHNVLSGQRDTGYSTTLKMMQVMHQKGLLKRDDTVRPQLYRPSQSAQKAQRSLINDLVQKAFGGAASRLLVQALSAKDISDDELTEIKELIRKMEEQRS
ncbi:MAG: BlaI/MecI/CopY family transcriptional regulator [Fuerstiella sp.]